jgi:putative PIN family toxin of toxin-antitoxin system
MLWVSYCTCEDGYRHELLQRARQQRVRFFVSDYILDELAAVLTERLNRTTRYASLSRGAILQLAKLVSLPGQIRRHVPGDPNDDPIVQTAISAKADYLITADKALLDLRKVRDIEIITAEQFEERLPPVSSRR